MEEKFLVVNAGSSSLKFSLYVMPEAREIVNGYFEKIGNEDSFYTIKYDGKKIEKQKVLMDHNSAVKTMVEELLENNFISDINEIKGIGHRIVHGGEKYSKSVVITDEVINDIDYLKKFATLHHPGELAGIKSMKSVIKDATQVAVFDTAFHQTIPDYNYMYAVPYDWYLDSGVRKYGAHGTSHKYITQKMQSYFNKENVNLIVCHIGSGASISVIKDGKCLNTTMGLTPLDGLIMGTRCGSIDCSIIEYICHENNLTVEEVTSILNKKSGMLGIASKNDFRDLEKLANEGDKRTILALKMFEKSVIKYIAQYYFELNGEIDALIFTAGVGENQIKVRENIINAVSKCMNVKLNKESNDNIARFKENQSGVISTDDSSFKVMVIPTDEEYMILKDTYELCKIKTLKK